MTEIRSLTLSEIQTLLDWAEAEGWNPGLADARAFHAADPNGFFGAFVDGQMAAGISTVAYDASFGFLGLYICHPDFRGRGLGRALWDAGMAYLGNRTIGLDGVPAQQANYASMGFVPAYGTTRWSGNAANVTSAIPTLNIGPEHLAAVSAVDEVHFPASRPRFLEHWLSAPNAALAIPAAGPIEGWAVCRPCRMGHKIGPLFAPDTEAALALVAATGADVQIDVPDDQTAFTAALAAAGFTPAFSTARMYRGPAPAVPMHRVFAVTSLELG